MTRKLAIVVSTSEASGDLDAACQLALAAIELGAEVSMFIMSDAVAGLPKRAAVVDRLAAQGCELTACAHSAHERGIAQADVGVVLGSQIDHAEIASRADRLVAFT